MDDAGGHMGPPPPRLGSAPVAPPASSLLLPRTSARHDPGSGGMLGLSGDADAGIRATNDDAQVSKL